MNSSGIRFRKMRAKLQFTLIILFSVLFFFPACSEKAIKPLECDLIDDVLLKYQVLTKRTETNLLDFSSPGSLKHLRKGWSKREGDFIWALGLTSTLDFYSFDNFQDKKIEITCAPLVYSEFKNQKIRISLNNEYINTINLKNGMHAYTSMLPDSKLRMGKNELRFDYAYSTKIPGPDKRSMSVRFESITFENNHKSRKDYLILTKSGNLKQYPGSSFTYANRFDSPARIIIDYKAKGNIEPVLKVSKQGHPSFQRTLPFNKSHVEYDISLIDNAFVKMEFILSGDKQKGSIMWKRIVLCAQEVAADKTNNVEVLDSVVADYEFERVNKPDIVIYIIDALRSDHLGCYGYERNTTPNIDAFARENTLFTNAFANASWTRASGATILTGLLPKNHKTMAQDSVLPADFITLAETLKEQGYYTVGFNTNGNVGREFGLVQGFDKFVSLPEDLERESIHVRSDVLNEKIFEFLNRFYQRPKKQPLFLWIWSSDPHDPYTPPSSVSSYFDIDKYEHLDPKFRLLSEFTKKVKENQFAWPSQSAVNYLKTLYDQEILFNDISFGKLIERLKKTELYEDSVLILTADHGQEFREHNWFGHGKTLFNEQVKIPLIIKAGDIRKGKIGINVQHADIYPTVLDILKIPLPYNIDGTSLLGNIDFLNRPIFAEQKLDGHDLRSLLVGDIKFIHNLNNVSYLHQARHENIFYEMYNLLKDPEEENNVVDRENISSAYFKQRLAFEYSLLRRMFDVKSERTDIPPELEEKLRALGYIK